MKIINRIAALVVGVALTIGTIALHNYIKSIPGESTPGNASTSIIDDMLLAQDDSVTPSFDVYDPSEDIVPNQSVTPLILDEYVYGDEIEKYPKYTVKRDEGCKLIGRDYSAADTALTLVNNTMSFSSEYSLDSYNATRVVVDTDGRGSSLSHTETVKEDAPLLRPYYGYIIYTQKGSVKLLNAQGSAVLADITGYEPIYRRTLAGEPLFKKGDKYYFYCDPETSKTVFYSDVDAESYTKLSSAEPTAASWFNYEYYLLLGKYYNAEEDKREVLVPDIAVQRPDKPSLVEYNVNEDTLISLTIPDSSYDESGIDMYPFYSIVDYTVDEKTGDFKINKLLWGYMDSKGKVILEPQYKAAYSFSADGFAVVVDAEDHVCIINKWGSVVCNPYYELYYTDENAPNIYSRIIYFKPDTYGTESTGMFTVDDGYLRVRKKFVDCSIGDSMTCYITKKESYEIVDTAGRELVHPADYNLVSYSDGLMLLEKDGRYGFMNTDGIWVIESNLRYAEPFSEGLAVVGYRPDKLGVIDSQGNVVMPFMYSHIEACSGGVITAYSEGNGWTVYNKLSRTADPESKNPVLDLKYRTLARAKYDYYKTEE